MPPVDAISPLPIWRVPHEFVSFEGGQPRSVVTFGLLCLRLKEVRHPEGVRKQGEAVGFEWLAATANRLRGRAPCGLSQFLHSEFGLSPNYATLATEGSIPDGIVERFADEEGARVADWAINAFGGLGYRLAELARERKRVPVTEHFHVALHNLGRLDPPLALRVRELRNGSGRKFYGVGYRDLVERAALEFFDLASVGPRIRLCQRCGVPFVPIARRGETGCPNNLWDVATGRPLRLCQSIGEVDVASKRERERKRVHQKWRRALERFGEGQTETIEAEREWLDWKANNPPSRGPGRPEKPWPRPDIHENKEHPA
jgi:hypothetical protein